MAYKNINCELEVTMKELGEYLKETRIESGVKLEEAAEDLGIRYQELENIESANMRAFKDVYELKQRVKEYAKYLGLDPIKIQEEFNDFLFEHTSKISLDDILEAKRKKEEEEALEKKKKISSPYTKEYKKKINFIPIIVCLFVFLIFIAIAIIVIKEGNKRPAMDKELKGRVEYEYTN